MFYHCLIEIEVPLARREGKRVCGNYCNAPTIQQLCHLWAVKRRRQLEYLLLVGRQNETREIN